jgi:hypothetical protein
MKGAWSTGDYTDDTETRSIRLWRQTLENEMKLQPIRREKLPRRNDMCPCGSGKKAKKCCLPSIKAFAALPQSVREQIVVARILQQRQPLLAAASAGSPAAPAVVKVTGGTITTEDGISIPIESGQIVAAANEAPGPTA